MLIVFTVIIMHAILEAPCLPDVAWGHVVSRSCWREGFNFFRCCTRDQPGGNPVCWDSTFTFEKCCYPPGVTRAAMLFEDINCDRLGSPWKVLRLECNDIAVLTSQGDLGRAAQKMGGHHVWRHSLQRRLGESVGECYIGRLAVQAACLLLCISQLTNRRCDSYWGALAQAMRRGQLQTTQLSATSWQVILLFAHLAAATANEAPPDPLCTNSQVIDWKLFYLSARSGSALNAEVMEVLLDGRLWRHASPFSPTCDAGHQWVSTIMMDYCARSEAKCVTSYSNHLDWRMRSAAASVHKLRKWVARMGDWKVFEWQANMLKATMRHAYTLSLNSLELQMLGIVTHSPPPMVGCLDSRTVDPKTLQTSLLDDGKVERPLERCRALCGWSRDAAGMPWAFFGMPQPPKELAKTAGLCTCAAAGVQSSSSERSSGNCSSASEFPLHAMPTAKPSSELSSFLLSSGSSTSVLSQAAGSAKSFARDLPVFVTMVFGDMSRFLVPFSERIRKLQIPNVVVFALDEIAMVSCRAVLAAQRPLGPQAFCMQGEGKNALQKYVVVLAYLAFGWDVFWFDFDSVWLQNPVPFIQSAVALSPEAEILSAMDFDSADCLMNAFFFVRSSEKTLTWLLSLLDWIYKRPYAHDQLAFVTLLGNAPLIDEDPLLLASPNVAGFDPNVFANAARFSGLGFSSEVEDLVLFHFFDGWNSGLPGSDVEVYATPIYRGINLFEVLYGGDEMAARAAIARSRLPALSPSELRSCRYRKDLGLGVAMTSWQGTAVPHVDYT